MTDTQSDKFMRFKKVALYILAAIGVLAIFIVLILPFLNSARRKSSVSYGIENPLGARRDPVSGLTQALLGEEVKSPSVGVSSKESGGVSEGQMTQRKIVKNGSLSLLVKKAEEIAQGIKSTAEKLGGFVVDSQIYEVSQGVKSGTITVRVPADRFKEAFEEIKRLGVRVERESESSRDETEQFIDLEARLKNLRAEEKQYLEILDRAKTVEEILQVSQPLNLVRGNIEQIEGQLKYLSRQVDMSTITVSLTAEADVEVFGIRWRPLFVLKQAFRNTVSGLTGYIDTMVSFILYLPILVLWVGTLVFLGAIVWRVFKLVRSRFFAPRPPNG